MRTDPFGNYSSALPNLNEKPSLLLAGFAKRERGGFSPA